MKSITYFGILLTVLLLNFQMADAAENEYGTVRAWFNGENATVTGIELKVGEPVEINLEVSSKVDGHVGIILTETGVTKAFEISNGPSKEDETIKNLNVEKGWSKTFSWIVKPNGAWKNGNAPINVVVQFYNLKKDNSKTIQFTIANPYILDERYSGAVSTPKPTTSSTATALSTPAKAAPFTSVLFAIAMLLLAACKIRR